MKRTKQKFGEGVYYKDNPKNKIFKVQKTTLRSQMNFLKSAVKKNGRVCIERFGCFEIRDIAGRKYFNKSVNRESHTRPYKKIRFVPSSAFKRFINE